MNNLCTRLSNKLIIGESSNYATLIMKTAFLDYVETNTFS
jgi:hypothetical protein